MLAAESIRFAYPRGPRVLDDIDLRLAPGRVTALIGPNGSGKSTLLRLLAGLLRPDAGRVELDARPIEHWTPAQRARRLAYIAQRPAVAFGFTVLDTVRFGLLSASISSTDAAIRALDRVGIAGRADEPFAHLSIGQQQRAALARAIAQVDAAQGQAALLADEPVAAMDPAHVIASLDTIREIARSPERPVACLVVLHDLSMAARYADEAVLLDQNGRLAARGPASEVIEPEQLQSVFGVSFRRVRMPNTPDVIVPLARTAGFGVGP